MPPPAAGYGPYFPITVSFITVPPKKLFSQLCVFVKGFCKNFYKKILRAGIAFCRGMGYTNAIKENILRCASIRVIFNHSIEKGLLVSAQDVGPQP